MTIAFPYAWLAIFLWLAISCNYKTTPDKEMTDATCTTTHLKKFDLNSITPNIIDCYPSLKPAVAGK